MKSILTDKQVKEILHLYRTVGTEAAGALAVQYGFKASYARKIAFKNGVKCPSRRWQPPRDRETDPRWAKAIAIGSVVI